MTETDASDLRSGEGHHDENFPVPSKLIHPRHRAIILAFYDFVRTADDIADHTTLRPEEKLAHLDRLEAALLGHEDGKEGTRLRNALRERGLPPRHAQDLLTAFRLDVTKLRYADWDDLIGYCRYSAMPVGRFMLDVHGESRATWVASDLLCAALQIINHLQDCAADYRELDRVYIPQDALSAAGLTVSALAEPKASPALRQCIANLADRTGELLEDSRLLSPQVNDTRLALEIAVIQTLAERLVGLLRARDPLSERVHLDKQQVALTGLWAVSAGLAQRLFRKPAFSRKPPAHG